MFYTLDGDRLNTARPGIL